MLLHFEELGLLSSTLFDPRVELLCSLQSPVAALAGLVPAVKYYTSGQGTLPPAPESLPASSQLRFQWKWKRLANLCYSK